MGGYSKTYSPNFGTSLSSLLLKSGGGAEEAGEPFQPVTLFILPHCCVDIYLWVHSIRLQLLRKAESRPPSPPDSTAPQPNIRCISSASFRNEPFLFSLCFLFSCPGSRKRNQTFLCLTSTTEADGERSLLHLSDRSGWLVERADSGEKRKSRIWPDEKYRSSRRRLRRLRFNGHGKVEFNILLNNDTSFGAILLNAFHSRHSICSMLCFWRFSHKKCVCARQSFSSLPPFFFLLVPKRSL